MFTCNICGKKFKTMQAIGGHMSSVHAQQKPDGLSMAKPASMGQPRGGSDQAQETSDTHEGNALEATETERAIDAVSDEPPQPADDDPGIMESIRKLREQGYSAKQIKDGFGYARQTVDHVFGKFIEPEGKPVQGKEQGTMPTVYKKDERAIPEVLLRDCIDGSYEDELELRGMMKLRAAILLAGELTSIASAAIKPVLDMMKEARAEQDAAAARARESSIEIAERAAIQGANLLAERVMPEVQALMEKQRHASAGSTVHERMFGPMADMMGQQMKNMFGGMFGMGGGQGQPGQPPQMTDEERTAIFGGGA